MSGKIVNIFNRVLKRGPGVPGQITLPKFPRLSQTKFAIPNVGRASIPPAAGVAHSQIKQVDPTIALASQKIQPPAIHPRKSSPKEGLFSGKLKWLAPAAAGAAAFLVPSLAYGATGITATLASFFSGLGPAGWIMFGIGAIATARLVISKYKALRPQNYQSRKISASFGSPTTRKLLKTLVLPAWGTATLAGGIFAYIGVAETVFAMPGITFAIGALLALRPATTIVSTMVKDIYHWYQYKFKGIQHNLKRPGLIGQLYTDLFQPTARLATIVFMLHMSKIYATQFFGTLLHIKSAIPAIIGSAASLAAMGDYCLWFAAGMALYRFFRGWPKNKIGNPIAKRLPRIVSTTLWAAGGAALGALVYAATPGLFTINILTFAVTLAFAHNFIHSTRSQEGGMTQAHKALPIFDKESLWAAVRSRKGATRTVFKPSIAMKEPLISSYIMMLTSEGANWVLNAITGAFNTPDYKQSQEIIEHLIEKDAQILRNVYKEGYQAVQNAQTTKEATEAAAQTFENVAETFQDLALGNFEIRSGLKYLDDGTLSALEPGSPKKRSDQDMIVHGEHIRFAARLYEAKARKLRAMATSNMGFASLKDLLTEKLEGGYRRAFPVCDTHPGRFYTNFLPDSYNAKQFVIDLCLQVMQDFVGGMDTVIMTRDGRIHMHLIPMKVVKDFKRNHEEELAIKSRDEQGEDLRFRWYERADHDIGDSLSAIAYIDNSAHYQKYKDLHEQGRITDIEFLSLYPTAEVPTPPTLKGDEFYDVVYKNGARLRIYADGSQQSIGNLAPDAPAVLMLPGTARHQFVASVLQAGHDQVVFDNIPLDTDLRKSLVKGKVPHPFGTGPFGPPKDEKALYFTEDPYYMPRWHFMYPTEYFSISDADQMDLVVTNLRLFHTRKDPHLRVMSVRPRQEKLPFSPDMLEEKHDSFLEVGIAPVWMVLKAKLKNGKEIFIPLNKNKENERSFKGMVGQDFWRYIDETQPLKVVKRGDEYFLKIPYREQARKDPAFRKAVSYQGVMFGGKYNYLENIEEIPVPSEMNHFIEEVEKDGIYINPERFGEVGGPRPVVDYFFTRRKANGKVTNSDRTLELSDKVANMLIFGKTSLLSEDEVEHWEMTTKNFAPELPDGGITNPREELPWTDRDGWVHMKMDKAEWEMLEQWIPEWQGGEVHEYREEDGELLIYVKHFEYLCERAYDEMTYRRFMQDHKFRDTFETGEVSL